MPERKRITARRREVEHVEGTPEQATPTRARRSSKRSKHKGAASGAVLGAVSVGPLGAPIGAAAGAVVDALAPDPNDPPTHTHDADAPCYDGCPAWHSRK
jgi:hypothetical protein